MNKILNDLSKITFAPKVMFHPFKSFWDIKKEYEGSLLASFSIAFLFVITSIIKKYLSGYIFNSDKTIPNLAIDLMQAVLPIVLWCISNWCLTTLMSGEGRMKDIVNVTCYALFPQIIGNVLYTILSNVLTKSESAFLLVLQLAFLIWTGALIVFGTSVAHQYTMSKTIFACLLTIVVMAIIIFLFLLVFTLLQEIFGLVDSMIKELAYRSLG